jgi:hypothetical protein
MPQERLPMRKIREALRLKAGGFTRQGDRALISKDPYVVMARFQRKFIDPNRPPEIAYDSPASAPFYEYYHRSIRQFVDEIRARYPAGILIDIHTQGKIPGSLRGTLNGRAVTHLLARVGIDAVTGPKDLFGQLKTNGFSVFPANDVPPSGRGEDGGFNGGYTVTRYGGSHHANGIDAIQFEFGTTYRQDAEVDNTAKRAAKSIVVFNEAYLRRPTD